MRRWQRWAAFGLGLVVLVAVPSIVAARPVHGSDESAQRLLARVRASDGLGYSGLVQTHGSLSLPAVPDTGDLAALLSGTTRLRVWWANPTDFRVDELVTDGEFDTTVHGRTTAQWDSTRNRAIFTDGLPPLRVPRADDLLPPALATRLTPDVLDATVARRPAVRIAGRIALGLRITPSQPRTTIRYVDIDVDQATGLPLGISITGRGQSSPSVSSEFVQVSIHQPPPSTLEFEPSVGALVSTTAAPDFIADVNRFAPFALPGNLAGLKRTRRVTGLRAGRGAATYGGGYTVVLLLPVLPSDGQQIIHALEPPVGRSVDLGSSGSAGVTERIALGNVLAFASGGRWYLLAGTVTPSVLRRGAKALIAHPPPIVQRRERSDG